MVLSLWKTYYINDHVDDRTKKISIKKTVNKLILIHLHSLIKNHCLFVINVIQYYNSRSEKNQTQVILSILYNKQVKIP